MTYELKITLGTLTRDSNLLRIDTKSSGMSGDDAINKQRILFIPFWPDGNQKSRTIQGLMGSDLKEFVNLKCHQQGPDFNDLKIL